MPTANNKLTPCWSQQEFEMLDLGDKRLTQRLITVASAIISLSAIGY
ncbi:hypothetical protein J4G02_04905 [Candidatus Poribacteria bacterium]|nr:hypothetical protein [Candidatus Poribacteria bacterium]